MKRLLTLLLLLSLPSIAYAEPITFYDLNWDMTVEQMQSNLESKGFVCHRNYLAKEIMCERAGENNDVEIHYGSGYSWIGFGCGAYNGCNYTIDDLYKEFKRRYGKARANYYWFGKLGDKLSILSMSNFDSPHAVFLIQGTSRDKLDF